MKNNNTRLFLPKKNRITGLYIFCRKCKGDSSDGMCRARNENGMRVKGKCPHHDFHVYRIRIHIPGTRKKKIVRTIRTRNEVEAVRLALELLSQYKRNGNSVHEANQSHTKIETLSEWIMFFLDEISPDNEKISKVRKLNKNTVKDYHNHFEKLREILDGIGMMPEIILPEQVDYSTVSLCLQKLREEYQLRDRTLKKYIATYRALFSFIRKYYKHNLVNHFQGNWGIANEEVEKEIITPEEFVRLIKTINEVPKFEIDKSGKNRLRWHPWLQDAFELALYSGLRRNEVANLKYSDIVLTSGKLKGGVLAVTDQKVTNIRGLTKPRIKPIAMNEDLTDFFSQTQHIENIGKNNFVIDKDEICSRYELQNILSRSFAYYISFLKLERKLSFKCLRKTYTTYCAGAVGEENVKDFTGHSSKEVIAKHYINSIEAKKLNGKFDRVFGKKIFT